MFEAVASTHSKASKQSILSNIPIRHAISVAAFVSVGYYLTAKIGFAFALQPGSVSTLWMPNAIVLAGLLLVPPRLWWIIVVGAFPGHLAAELQSGVPFTMVLSWFISNTFQALVGAVGVNYFLKGRLRFDSFHKLAVFLVMAASLAPFLASFLDLALLTLNGWAPPSFWQAWRVRFLSNVLATMTLVPVIITWANNGFKDVLRVSFWRALEAVSLVAGLFLVGIAAFTESSQFAIDSGSLLYWPLPVLLWATVRFGPRGISTLLLLLMFIAIYGAKQGLGPFVGRSSAENAVAVQCFLIVISITLMSLAAVIAERRAFSEALSKSEAQLARAEALSVVMVTHIGLDGRWLKVPPQLCELLGHGEDELLAQTSQNVTHPDDFEFYRKQCHRLTRGEIKSFDLEQRYRHKNGNTIWVYLNCSIVEDEEGLPVHFLTYIREITDRKIAEQALLEINARNRAILRALPDLMFLHTREGVYLDFYARDVNDLKVPPEAFLGKNMHDILPAEVVNGVDECVARLDRSDEPQVTEYALEMNGEERIFEARLVLAEADNVLSIVRDITETRHATEALRRGEQKLLQSNRQIRSLAARLITAQESERRRIAVLLHDDLSQNIATLGITISRLRRRLADSGATVTDELDRIAQQLHDLTTQIRQLSHQLHPEVLEHVGLIPALESYVAEFGYEEGIDVKFNADVQTEPIPLDVADGIYRVAFEALRNVSRHSGARSATICLAESEGCLTLEVSDSGQGFDVERTKRGSGIGLISSEERVKLLQGSFEIRSIPDVGTVLTAIIPIGGRNESHEDSLS
jgi:PAS domain S-box-containing protein